MMTSQIKADSQTVNDASSSLINSVSRVFQLTLDQFRENFTFLNIYAFKDRDGSRHKIKTKLHATKIINY